MNNFIFLNNKNNISTMSYIKLLTYSNIHITTSTVAVGTVKEGQKLCNI